MMEYESKKNRTIEKEEAAKGHEDSVAKRIEYCSSDLIPFYLTIS